MSKTALHLLVLACFAASPLACDKGGDAKTDDKKSDTKDEKKTDEKKTEEKKTEEKKEGGW